VSLRALKTELMASVTKGNEIVKAKVTPRRISNTTVDKARKPMFSTACRSVTWTGLQIRLAIIENDLVRTDFMRHDRSNERLFLLEKIDQARIYEDLFRCYNPIDISYRGRLEQSTESLTENKRVY
jgi:hypothetical protein